MTRAAREWLVLQVVRGLAIGAFFGASLLIILALSGCGDGPTAPSRDKVQPVPTVIR